MTIGSALVTAGPTREWLDPVRFLSNGSSGMMGYAIAEALEYNGIATTLISGPTRLSAPHVSRLIRVETAEEMMRAAQQSLPADVAVCVAAVSDWRPVTRHRQKLKKDQQQTKLTLELERTPDILDYIGHLKKGRPRLVIGFALESEHLVDNAAAKRLRKNADWIFANPLGTVESARVALTLIREEGTSSWPELSKDQAATRIAEEIKDILEGKSEAFQLYHR